MGTMHELRDEIYTRILLKRTLGEFSFNNFDVERTHIPFDKLENLAKNYPGGKIWIIAGVPGGITALSRTNLVLREYSCQVGYRKADQSNNLEELDLLESFIEELEFMCRKEVTLEGYSFSRLEYLQDENNVPFNFYNMSRDNLFEACFSVFFNRPLIGVS